MKKDLVVNLMIDQGLCNNKDEAKRLIMTGNVFVKTQRVNSAGAKYPLDTIINIKGKDKKYVSRGGIKLESAISKFNLKPNGKVCIDIGSSTGGFTDCLLQNGAKMVYSVDVGTNQLDYSLRKLENVISMEKTNIKDLSKEMFDVLPVLGVCDVSFIGLYHVFKTISKIGSIEQFMGLIKPQFEAEKHVVDAGKGVVRGIDEHIKVINKVIATANEFGYFLKEIAPSPIKGKESSNIEYITLFDKIAPNCTIDINNIVEKALK